MKATKDGNCADTQFRCSSTVQCISWDFYCDLIQDCVDKSDETTCVPRPCDTDEWRCSNNQCISSFKVCDLTPDCRDGSDELICKRCKGFRCTDGTCIPYNWQCDGIVDCSGPDREDEHSDLCSLLSAIDSSTSSVCYWRAEGGYNAMPRYLTGMDGCDTVTCEEGYYKCPHSYCIPIAFVCNGVMDCVDGADESACYKYQCPGYYRCRKSTTCIRLQKVCNNNVDCPQGDDEMSCDFRCPSTCNCTGSVLRCLGTFWGNETFGSLTRKLDLSFSNLDQLTDISFQGLHMLAVLSLSNCHIQNLKWKFWELKNLMSLYLSYNNISHLKRNAFRGLHNLRLLDLSENRYLTIIEIGAFDDLHRLTKLRLQYTGIQKLRRLLLIALSNLISLNISYSKLQYIEDHTFKNQKSLKYLYLDQTKISDFGHYIFNGLDDLEILRAGVFTLCCPRVRPSSVEDDKCFAPQDEFSSCEDLMQNNVLRAFIWILGVASLTGNSLTIIYRLCIDKSSLSKGCGYFILNLGFSDFFMGVYMIFIGSADVLYRGKYLWYANFWKQSPWCKTAGFLSTLSSEVSTMLICLITLDRLLAIKFPFGQIRFNKKSYIVACVLAWLLGMAMALVPLLPATSHWNLFGRNSVCLALPLSRDRAPGWQYSTSIFLGFNLVAFTFIAVAQVVIYRVMKSVSIVKDKKRLTRERAVARKLSLVVLTDFACWFPVVIIGLAALGGVPIAGEIYAWTAVFILPVNSALNPFLYTLSAYRQKRKDESKLEMYQQPQTKCTERKYSSSGEDCPRRAKREKNFFVGCPEDNMQQLQSYLESASPSQVVATMLAVFEALPVLQDTVGKHDTLTGENIFIGCLNKNVNRVCFDVSDTKSGRVSTMSEELHNVCSVFQNVQQKY
ncbi:G-protein coupled receptor GRL101-like [Gigantopelta aegis]|uniref:G-protein coupled receptor GRL101-like n=1 Tax=Gigantopelta aegis TaxID=1735272 RepID=UPI001B88761F|nr:G-protein coupled receptor GRL101-like [Gigantopelta aegis]